MSCYGCQWHWVLELTGFLTATDQNIHLSLFSLFSPSNQNFYFYEMISKLYAKYSWYEGYFFWLLEFNKVFICICVSVSRIFTHSLGARYRFIPTRTVIWGRPVDKTGCAQPRKLINSGISLHRRLCEMLYAWDLHQKIDKFFC